MQKVVKFQDGTKAVLNTKSDVCLYRSPVNPPSTGLTYTRGNDYYYHTTIKGKRIFYRLHWSLWEGEHSWIEVISEGEAKEELEGLVGAPYGLDADDADCRKLWPDFGQETA